MTISGLYAVLDADVAAAHGWTVPDLALAVLDGGCRLLQVRGKRLSSAALLATCEAVVRVAEPASAVVMINDRTDVARLCGADGVHVVQHDLPPEAVRRLIGDAAIVGWSTHTAAQIEDARTRPVSYVAVGPVFGTTTNDTGYAPVGTELVRLAAERAEGRPIVAIGGIVLDRVLQVIGAGASAVAAIGDLFTGGDPAARARAYVARLREAELSKL